MTEKPPKFAEADGAPYVTIDTISSTVLIEGVIQINTYIRELRSDSDGHVTMVSVPSGHLRMTPQAAQRLIAALQDSIDMTNPQKNAPPPGVKRQ
jgi:hypothetical protein